jgi:hypothetical protein
VRRAQDPEVTTSRPEEVETIPFPSLVAPSAESLMEGADDAAVAFELDRLLGDFLGSLSATSKALSRIAVAGTNGYEAEKV